LCLKKKTGSRRKGLRTDGDFCDTKGGTQKLPKKFKIVETYGHDHSLDGTRSFSIQLTSFGRENAFSEYFSVLKELKENVLKVEVFTLFKFMRFYLNSRK
jgi:hypothetical protein